MDTLKLGGQVLWAGGTAPVGNARVRIYDIDSGGNGNDLIFDERTDGQGRFRGVSGRWRDHNEVRGPMGVRLPVPDALLLEFRVNLPDGRTHRGPYIHTTDYGSVPIVLPIQPGGATGPIQKAQRELIHVVTLQEGYQGADRLMYEVVEFGAAGLSATAGPRYNRLRILQGGNATLERLKQELQAAAAQPGIRAVDLVVSTHGKEERLWFQGGSQPTTAVAAKLREIPEQHRRKFRAVFSTACFGLSHANEWLSVGFEVAAGSRRIYADGAASYPAFLAAWLSGVCFQKAVDAANAADPLRLMDNLARARYQAQGNLQEAGSVESFREVRGDGALTIDSAP